MNTLRIAALYVPAALFCSLVSAAAEPVQTEHWVGTNYTPAYACNQVQFWHDFRAEIVETELAAAKKFFAL
ncbi:MAG: hypothetical protein LBT46_04685, partial [Planctomycetaceae bacterium]|nr:hypothetical protein [Planctomycetaceae bacterium]